MNRPNPLRVNSNSELFNSPDVEIAPTHSQFDHRKDDNRYQYEDYELNEREALENDAKEGAKLRSFRPPSFSGPDVNQDGFASRHSKEAKQQVDQENERARQMPKPEKKQSEWTELTFRIKLTAEEYSLYLHEKAKRM